jgi:hypothetical protein
MLTRPRWIEFGVADLRTLRFLWDDARVHHDFTGDASAVLEAAPRMSVRARLALLVGLYEWVVWRFDGLHRRQEPTEILQAAWCGTVDPRYLAFFELTREDWVGPVEGPLWCAFTFLEDGFRQSHAFQADTYRALEFLYRLAFHVLPDPRPFEGWLHATLTRFVEGYPTQPEDPFRDLFENRIGEHLGEFIGRDALNPAIPVDVARDRTFLAEVLQQTRVERNPFLAREGDLKDRKFEGVPYTVPSIKG